MARGRAEAREAGDTVASRRPQLPPRGDRRSALVSASVPQEERIQPRGTLNEKRWGEILDAAEQVFLERGYQAASLQEIAKRVGMLKGSLYYYIDTKEDLLFEIVRRSHQSGLDFLREEEEEAGYDAPTRVRNLTHRWVRGMNALNSSTGVVEGELRHLGPERRAQIFEMRRQIQESTEAIIVQGIDDGVFDPDLNVRVTASTLLRMLNTTMSWFRPARLGMTPDELADWYAHLFLAGVTTRQNASS
jgi:AcrR family transcriptional regulator